MSDIQFWYAAGACSLAPHILLNEVGAAYSGVEISMSPTETRLPPGFEKINPKLRVPVISIDGQIITEVPAVATVISHLAPARQLMGRTALETARLYELMIWISGSLHGNGFGCLWKPQRYSDEPAAHAGISKKALQTIKDCFAMIEGKIAGPYALGDAFTALDAYLFVFYRWGHLIGMDLARDYPKYEALGRLLAERPAVAKTLAIEKIDAHGLAAA